MRVKRFSRDTDKTLFTGLVESYNFNYNLRGAYAGLDLSKNSADPVYSLGKKGYCVNFTEAQYGENFLILNAPITTVLNNFTVCMWVNMPVALTAGSFFYNGLISPEGQNTGWGVGIGDSSTNTTDKGKHLIFSYVNTLKNVAFVRFFIDINSGWHFILVERDNGVLRGYVDTVIASNTSAVALTRTPTVRTIVGANAIPVLPGISSRQPNAGIDMLNVWEKILSANEKLDMWNDGNGNPLIVNNTFNFRQLLRV